MACDLCGSTKLHMCTGHPPKPWTLEEKERLYAILREYPPVTPKPNTLKEAALLTSPTADDTRLPLTRIAQLIVDRYGKNPDDFILSIGHWQDDPDMPPLKEFVAYLAIPMADWKVYAKGESSSPSSESGAGFAIKAAPSLTDAELSDIDFVRGYIESSNETVAEVHAENERLRAEIAALKSGRTS